MSRFFDALRRLQSVILRPLKAAARHCERTLARRLSQRYAGEISQFDNLARSMRELGEEVHARLDKQEGFQWDHVALARRLARLEDHVEQLLQQAARSEMPDDARDDFHESPMRRGSSQQSIAPATEREISRAECIPFRPSARYLSMNASSQEAA